LAKKHPWYQEMAENLEPNDPEMLAAVIEFDQMHEQYEYERLFPLIRCPVLIIQASKAQMSRLHECKRLVIPYTHRRKSQSCLL
jgi:hypothetical protein